MQLDMTPGWGDEIAKMAFEAVSQRFQPILDGVHAEFGGQPIDVVKHILVERGTEGNEGACIEDPELTNIATAISEGRRVVMTNGGFDS